MTPVRTSPTTETGVADIEVERVETGKHFEAVDKFGLINLKINSVWSELFNFELVVNFVIVREMDETIAGSVSGLKKFFGVKRAWIFVGCDTDVENQFIIDEINFFEAVFVKAKF